MKKIFSLVCLFFVFGDVSSSAASAYQEVPMPQLEEAEQNFRRTLGALVKANTSNPPGNEKLAVDILAARLKAEGIPFERMEFGPNRENLVARLRGKGTKRPLLLLAHIDVVGTEQQEWTVPKHEMTEKDGYLYGRGVFDDFAMAVANLEVFLAIKRSGQITDRDIILAYTGDEESGGAGLKALMQKHPEWVDAELVLNEGGGIILNENGSTKSINLVSAEKVYLDFEVKATGTSGHSSVPTGDNAIYLLAAALHRLDKNPRPARLMPTTRNYFLERAALEPAEMAAAMRALAHAKGPLPQKALSFVMKNPRYAALLRTTCTATVISGGSRANSLPTLATSTINCRILPDEKPADIQAWLEKTFADRRLTVKPTREFGASSASPVAGPVPDAVAKVASAFFPNTPIIPSLQLGATDSRFFRAKGIAAYGISPIAIAEADISRAHGVDERIAVSSIRPGLRFWYNLVREIAGAEGPKTLADTKN